MKNAVASAVSAVVFIITVLWAGVLGNGFFFAVCAAVYGVSLFFCLKTDELRDYVIRMILSGIFSIILTSAAFFGGWFHNIFKYVQKFDGWAGDGIGGLASLSLEFLVFVTVCVISYGKHAE